MSCKGCPLEGKSKIMKTRGKADAPYLIVTDVPSHHNSLNNQLLSRRAEEVLFDSLSEIGMRKKDFVIHPAIRCHYDADLYSTAEQREIRKCCRDYLVNVVKKQRPEMIIPLGALPAQQVLNRAVKITKIRGVFEWSDEHHAGVLPFFGPAYVSMYPQHLPAMRSDCRTMKRLIKYDFDMVAAGEETLGDYEYIDDLQFLIDMDPEFLCFDIETQGSRWYAPGAKILTMQFCVEEGKAYMLVWDHPENPAGRRAKRKLKAQLQELLQNPETIVLGQNLKYDCLWVYTHLGFRFRIGGDTNMLFALIDENSTEKNQDALVKMYVPDMAGYADCVVPETEILTADMRKVSAGSLRIGDELCAFTANTDGRKASRRKMAKSVVLGTQRLRRHCLRITTESGRSVVVSRGHLMLAKSATAVSGGGWRWKKAYELNRGDILKPFPWEDPLTDYDAGYVSGVIDGEGWFRSGRLRLGVTQQAGPVLTKTLEVMQDAGLTPGHRTDNRKAVPVVNINFDGADAIRALQLFRPLRLLDNASWQDAGLPTNGIRHDVIVDIDGVGEREVVGLKTSTQTIISNGLLSHNSFNAEHDKGNMQDVPLDEILNYGCGDVDSCLRLYFVLWDIVAKDKKLFNHYFRVSLPALNAFVPMEAQGQVVDEDEFERFTKHMEGVVEEQARSLLSQTPRSIIRNHAEKGLKFTRPDFVRDILFNDRAGFRLKPVVFTKKTQKLDAARRIPSTSLKDHLPFFFDDCPYTFELAQHLKDSKMLSTNVYKFAEKYMTDGMIYPTYTLTTAVTGRTSCKDPNGQAFPKRGANAKAYRRCFKAPPGWIILTCDLSQAELRIAADMANDRTMIRIYRSGGDIHKYTACIVMGISMKEFEKLPKEEQDLGRFKAKACNFGYIYGMWWRKFRVYAKTQYGVEFTDEEAEQNRNDFFDNYNGLGAWHERAKEKVRRDGFVRSYDGRIRHLPTINSDEEFIRKEAERQGINAPVQEFASSLGLMSLGRIDRNVDPEYFRPRSFVHDEIAALVRPEHIVWGAKTLKYFMESNPLKRWFGISMKVPIVADVGFGLNLGQQFEMKGLKTDDTPYDLYSIEGLDFDVPDQVIPPNNGRIICPDYMQPVA